METKTDPLQDRDPWVIRDAKGRTRPAPSTPGDFLPPGFSSFEHKCETPLAKSVVEQCSYYEPISETSEARALGVEPVKKASGVEPSSEPKRETGISDAVLDAVEKILEEGMTDQQKRDEAERIASTMSLPWRPKKQPVKNLFVDPSTLPAGSFAFGLGNAPSKEVFQRLSGGM